MRIIFFILAVVCWTAVSAQERVLGPYLQNAEPTSIKVMWETSIQTTSRVRYGLTPGLGTAVTGSSQTGFLLSRIHTVPIAGLQPNTTYYYSVNFGNRYSDTLMFRTPPSDPDQSFNMVAFSDMQVDLSQPDKFREIVEDGVIDYVNGLMPGDLPDKLGFVLVPGDLVAVGLWYPSWKDEFFEPGRQLFSMVPVYPVLGNHEANTVFFFNYFDLPDNGSGGYLEQWWYKDYANTRIIGLESNTEYITANNGRQKQLDWLDDLLEDACADDDLDFVFAQLHHPYESELWPDGNNDYVGEAIDRLGRFSTDCGKPSILFFGHTHGYSRGQTLDHQHLLVNVASAGGNLDLWGEYGNQTDYAEFSKSEGEYGFVYLEVEGGAAPKFTMKRISRGSPGNILDNAVHDSVVVYKDDNNPAKPVALSPAGSTINAQCVLLEAGLFGSEFQHAEHGASQWQVFNDCSILTDPVADVWRQYENWYFDVNTQEGDDLTDQEITGLAPNSDYCWRVRYRDRNLRWSAWSDPVAFSTGDSYNVLVNGGGEYGTNNWTTVAGHLESLTANQCDSREPWEGQRFFCVGAACDPAPYGEAYQLVDVSDKAASIDAGGHNVYFGGYLADYNGMDKPEFRLSFLDGDSILLGQTPRYGNTHDNWRAYDKSAEAPPGTRLIRFEIFGTRGLLGVANDSYLDGLYLVVDSTAGRIDTAICEGETLTLFGQTFDAPGTYTVFDELSPECINEYEIVIAPADTVFTDQLEEICAGDSVEVGGTYYTEAGSYLVEADDPGNCPAYIRLTVSVLPPGSEFCLSTGIKDDLEEGLLSVFPNPVKSAVTFRLAYLPAGRTDIVLFDAAGSEVRRLEGITAATVRMDRGALPAGSYFYALQNANSTLARGTMIVQD